MTPLEQMLMTQLKELSEQFNQQSTHSTKQFEDLQQQLNVEQSATATALERVTTDDGTLEHLPISLKCRDCKNSATKMSFPQPGIHHSKEIRVSVFCKVLHLPPMTYQSQSEEKDKKDLWTTHCSEYEMKAKSKQK